MKTLVLFFILALSACGMQGDLYLPDAPADKPAVESSTKTTR